MTTILRIRINSALFTVLILAATLIGCASPAHRTTGPHYTADRSLSAQANLERFAQLEAEDQNLTPLLVPVPPGVEPQTLALRCESDRLAWMSWSEALSELKAGSPRPAQQAEAPAVDHARQTAALRHFARGREAALADRYYVAITEFHRALEIDPDAVPVLRELARSHLALGNAGKAVEFYSRVRQLAPNDEEALLALAQFAAGRRDWEAAATLLAQHYMRDGVFAHDHAAEALAQFTLAMAFRHLGYDRASIEAARRAASASTRGLEESMYAGQLASLHRQQADLWRAVGDAHCRLGEYAEAVEAYAIASVLPSPDPASLHPRVIFAQLRLGRVFTAQYELLAVLRHDGSAVADRDIRLCAFIAEHVPDRGLLRGAVSEHFGGDPDSPEVARVMAALLPRDEGTSLLREIAERRPRDLDGVTHAFRRLGEHSPQEGVRLLAHLVEAHPDLAGDYVTRLFFALPEPANILEFVRAQQQPEHVALNIESRVLAAVGALGEAWQVSAEARKRRPEEPSTFWLQLDLLALLEEPGLLPQVLADGRNFDDPVSWMFRARAHRALSQHERAIEAAERAVALAASEDEVSASLRSRAKIELSAACKAFAFTRTNEEDARYWAEEAARVAERAAKLDPARESAFEILISLYGPNGRLSDRAALGDVANRLFRLDPESRLYARLSAEEMISHGRYEPALERLLSLYDIRPHDTRALALAIEAWSRAGELDEALAWLEARRREQPGNPAILEQWVKALLQLERGDEAIQVLRESVDRDVSDHTALRLLESAYRAMGLHEAAFGFGERRLRALPGGLRRDIELAALYGGVGEELRAIEILEHVRGEVAEAETDMVLAALSILERLHDDETMRRREELIVAYVSSVVGRGIGLPLQVYGLGMRSLARLQRVDTAFDELAEGALRNMPHGAGPQVVIAWRDLAQALVDAGEPAAAARAMRPILRATELHEPPASDVLATVAIVADAAASGGQCRAGETIELIEELASSDRLPRMPGLPAEGDIAVEDVLFQASQIYSMLGHYGGVERLLRRVLELSPEDALSMNNLGYMRIEAGHDDEETVALIERAHEMSPADPHIADTLGWLRYRQGVWLDEPADADSDSPALRGALGLLREALDEAGDPPAEVYDHLGDVLWRLKRTEDAIEAWRIAESLLSEPGHRRQIVQNLHLLQVRGWGLHVADPEELYDLSFGAALRSVRAKIAAALDTGDPPITTTFAELRRARMMPRAAAVAEE